MEPGDTPNLCPDSFSVADLAGPPVDLHHPLAHHALCKVLVRGPDADFLHLRRFFSECRRGGKRIIRLQLHHGPHEETECAKGIFQGLKLGQERGVHTGTRLVPRPQGVAKGFDDMVGGHAQVRGPCLHHLQKAVEDQADSAVSVIGFRGAFQPVETPKELVGAVDQVDDQFPGTL